MIHYAKTNLNTEAKQVKIIQAPLLTVSLWFSRVVIARGIHAWYSRELVFPAAVGNTSV